MKQFEKNLLYTPYKIFHFSEKLNSLAPNDTPITPPLHIRIKPTNLCNHHCWYCAYRADDLQLGESMNEKDEIPEPKMMEIIEDIIEMKVKAVTFSGGGEPFLYKPLLKVVRRLTDSSVQFAALSNGSRLDGELAEAFANHATWLRISLDGWNDESYQEYRGTRLGEFSQLLERLETFSKLSGSCYLGISLNVDQKNAPHIRETVLKLQEAGVQSVKIAPCILSNDAQECNDYHNPVYSMVRKQIEQILEETVNDPLEIFDSYHRFEAWIDKDYNWCPFVQILTVIGADLNVYSCQDKAYNLREGLIGSLQHQSFQEFWLNDREKFYRVHPPKDCKNHCVSNQKNQMIWEYLHTHPIHRQFV